MKSAEELFDTKGLGQLDLRRFGDMRWFDPNLNAAAENLAPKCDTSPRAPVALCAHSLDASDRFCTQCVDCEEVRE